MVKTSKKAFFYPSQSQKTSSDSPSDKVNKQILSSTKKNNAIINLTQGKISSINLEEFQNREKISLNIIICQIKLMVEH